MSVLDLLSTPLLLSLAALTVSYFLIRRSSPLDAIPSIPPWDNFRLLFNLIKFEDYWIKTKYYANLPLQKFFMGRYIVLASDKSHAKHIFPRADVYQKPVREGALRYTLDGMFFGLNILDANGDLWKKYRRAMQPAFSKIWPTQLFTELTHDMLAEWDKAIDKGEEIEVTDWMQRLTMEILGRGLFDLPFNAIKDANARPLTLYRFLMKGFSNIKYAAMPLLDRRWNPWRRPYWEAMDELNAYFLSIINEKKQKIIEQRARGGTAEKSKKEKDLFTLMLESFYDDDNAQLSDEELRCNAALLMLAGHDTTASALVSEIYELAKDQDLQKRAREEVMTILGDAEITQRTKLPIIEAIINEALRMYPPAVTLPIRQTSEDTQLEGKQGPVTIPKGTIITFSINAVHHNPNYWENPEQFNVDRWLKKDNAGLYDADATQDKRPVFYPFGGGVRICIGMNFSLLEQRIALVNLLKNYEWTLPANSPHQHKIQAKAILLYRQDPMNVVFKRISKPM